jgi:hypothetical protein
MKIKKNQKLPSAEVKVPSVNIYHATPGKAIFSPLHLPGHPFRPAGVAGQRGGGGHNAYNKVKY